MKETDLKAIGVRSVELYQGTPPKMIKRWGMQKGDKKQRVTITFSEPIPITPEDMSDE